MPKLRPINQFDYIGIDPGQNGGLVALYPDGEMFASAMPSTERDVWDWFRKRCPNTAAKAVIEKVHAMPKQGVSSSFKFGVNYGFLRGCLTAIGIPFEEIQPQTWQKSLRIPSRGKSESKTQFKNRLKGLAQQYFPSENVTLKTADALLIAEYCRRKNTGTL